MERGADLGQENLAILSTQILERNVPNFFQNLATSITWLRVNSGKGLVIVSRFKVVLFLFPELQRQPGDDGCQRSGNATRVSRDRTHRQSTAVVDYYWHLRHD